MGLQKSTVFIFLSVVVGLYNLHGHLTQSHNYRLNKNTAPTCDCVQEVCF